MALWATCGLHSHRGDVGRSGLEAAPEPAASVAPAIQAEGPFLWRELGGCCDAYIPDGSDSRFSVAVERFLVTCFFETLNRSRIRVIMYPSAPSSVVRKVNKEPWFKIHWIHISSLRACQNLKGL